MKSSLAVAALENAVRSRHPGETVVHSDHDSPLELPDSSGQGRPWKRASMQEVCRAKRSKVQCSQEFVDGREFSHPLLLPRFPRR